MKKYFIIAVAALVAGAACSKVETVDNRPDKKISFEVANYSGQTKAAGDTISVLAETSRFSSKAWLHANDAATGTDFFGTATNKYTEDVNYNGSNAWEPTLEYFWPKGAGSYVNFVSWYTKNQKAQLDSAAVTETLMEWGTGANPVTIVTDDNILFADEAWRYTDNAETYKFNGVTKGVPTLFHHALAKLAFNVRLSTITTSTKSVWDVDIDTVELKVGNNGYLTLSNEDPVSNTTRAWKVGADYSTGLAATSENIGWVRPTTPTLETIVEDGRGSETEEFIAVQFSDFKPTTLTSGHAVSGEFQVLLPERTVMPQVIDGGVVTFKMTFYIRVFHADSNGDKAEFDGVDGIDDNDAFSTELITIEKNLHDLVGAIDNWKMNTKYTYNITIDPVGKTVLFDPAVVKWATTEEEQEIYNAAN
ncbi:MAG: hypothetical protein IKZ60_04780 [Bacteroidales bacterium]|nr:hypothetical protein [Bacteroidales bacterium]